MFILIVLNFSIYAFNYPLLYTLYRCSEGGGDSAFSFPSPALRSRRKCMKQSAKAAVIASAVVLCLLCVTLPVADQSDATGNTYYVDSANGSETGDGSKSNPWKTIDYNTVETGDTVYVSGNLSSLSINRAINVIANGEATASGPYFVWNDILSNASEQDDKMVGTISFTGITFTGMTNDTINPDYPDDCSGFTLKFSNCDFIADGTHMSLCAYRNYELIVDGCDFSFKTSSVEHEKENTYAMFIQNPSGLTVKGCTFDGYSRFINVENMTGEMSVTGCEFGDLVPVESGNDEARAIQIAGDMEGVEVKVENNKAINEDMGEYTGDSMFFSVHGGSTGSPDVTLGNNNVSGFDSLAFFFETVDGSIPTAHITSENNTCTDSTGQIIADPIMAENGHEIPEDLVTVVETPDEPADEPVSPPSYDDDEELPPMIRPGTSSSDDDSVTIVACAAAAVVAALMAVFLIVSYKKE